MIICIDVLVVEVKNTHLLDPVRLSLPFPDNPVKITLVVSSNHKDNEFLSIKHNINIHNWLRFATSISFP